MKYMPTLVVQRTKGPRPDQARQRNRMEDDPLYVFGLLLRITERQALEKKYPNRKRNMVRLIACSGPAEPV